VGDSRNADYIERNFAVESRLTKAALAPADKPRSSVRFYLQTYRALKGTELAVSTTVLDFGCAFGSVVDVLLGAGYDAYGVDILEYWGKDEELCGEIIVHYPAEVKSRLKLLDAETSRVPFSDDSFEVVVSDQVLEHVFDLRSAFREQARVLKPGGLAIHRMPRRHGLFEAHTKIPLASLNRFRWYLALFALAGWRNSRQAGLSWREVLKSNEDLFGTTHYVSKRTMLASARAAGLSAYFLNHLPIVESRIGHLYRKLDRFGLAGLARPFLMILNMTQVLILEKPAS
jgi:SAM-dependent methyltransferase